MKTFFAFGAFVVAVMFAVNASAMQLTKTQLDKGIKVYMKEVPQCSNIKLTRDLSAGDSAWFYTLQQHVEIDILVKLSGSAVDSIQVNSADRSNEAMRDMMCVTVALMRGIQPEYITVDEAIDDAAHLWANAAKKPFKKAFFFDTFTARLTPFSLTIE